MKRARRSRHAPLAGLLAAAVGVIAVACTSGGPTLAESAPGQPVVVTVAPSVRAPARDLTIPAPVPAPTAEPAPTQPAAPTPSSDPVAPTGEPTQTLPAPTPSPTPRPRVTPTPTPVFIAPETRTNAPEGLTVTADNIKNLYDPFQPKGDREIGYAQYRPAVPRDAIVPIYVPRIRNPDELQIPLTPEELVLGVFVGGEARAYPVGLMRFRELANDTLGGVPILVSW